MVSVHSTNSYNNFIYNFPKQELEIVDKTLYSYISSFHKNINVNDYNIRNKFSSIDLYHTVFLPVGEIKGHILNYTYAGKLDENITLLRDKDFLCDLNELIKS